MKQRGFTRFLILLLAVVVTAIGGYLIFVKHSPPSLIVKNGSKDSNFTPSGYGWVTGCVNVQFKEDATKEQAKLLLQQQNIAIPDSLSQAIKPYGVFVPTAEVIVQNFDQTAALLKKDSHVADVQLNYGPTNDGYYFVYVLFADSMTLDRAYQLLNNTYRLRVNGNQNYPGVKATTIRLSVVSGTEDLVVKNLLLSSIVQDALQCPVLPPARPSS